MVQSACGRSRSSFMGLVCASAIGCLFVSSCSSASGETREAPSVVASNTSLVEQTQPIACTAPGEPTGPGVQKVALLIAVEDYPQGQKWKLNGPIADLEDYKDLIQKYGYEEDNICVLTDSAATFENVALAFKYHLADRLDTDDEVTIYYAGHGTELDSSDADELSGKDQALVLYDSDMARPDGLKTPYLIDDDFAGLLSLVRDKTQHITVVIDSCNSGTATRGAGGTDQVGVRFAPRLNPDIDQGSLADSGEIMARVGAKRVVDRDASWSSVAPEGSVVLAAARDGTVAKEHNGHGKFTSALIESIQEQKGAPITLQALERRLRVKFAGDAQTPVIHGNHRQFFLSTDKQAPVLAMSVAEPIEDGQTSLIGLRMASSGVGAEYLIYDDSAEKSDFDNPARAKAAATVTAIDGPKIRVTVTPVNGAAQVAPGDLAVQVAPSKEARLFNVDATTIDNTKRAEILSELAGLKADAALVHLTDDHADFILTEGTDGKYTLTGPDGRTRNAGQNAAGIAQAMANHARQWSLRQLGGDGGDLFTDDHTLTVQLVTPAESDYPKWSYCVPEFTNVQTKRFEKQRDRLSVPFCAYYALEISADIPEWDTNTEINVGAFVFSHDGEILPLGKGQQIILSGAKPRYIFNKEPNILQAFIGKQAFRPDAPLEIQEQIVVFGVDANSPIPWELFGTETTTGERRVRSSGNPVSNPLFDQLDSYIAGGQRAKNPSELAARSSPWTVTKLEYSTRLNPAFAENADLTTEEGDSREYTLASFDISPYLPADRDGALAKVLLKADELAKRSSGYRSVDAASDGYPYKQHNWCAGSDAANLEKGIDCSRSIWYAFTRSGLKYTDRTSLPANEASCRPYGSADNDYLTTADMVGPTSPLATEFDDCMADRPFRTGDVLVYRDETRGVGHTVMVIDPVERVAWGSHGWDGNPLLGGKADTGVEYQDILRKPDWGAWDRKTMTLKACWRHKEFEPRTGYNLDWFNKVSCAETTQGYCTMR